MTLAQFRARYPQFASIGNDLVNAYLSEALLEIGEAFEDQADRAQGLYAAHYCAVEAEERARATAAPNLAHAGNVVSESAGRLSVSRSAEMLKAAMDDPMKSTTYGQRFCFIRDRAGKGAVASGAKQLDDGGTGLCASDDLVLPVGESIDGPI